VANIVEIIVKAKDEASRKLQQIGSSSRISFASVAKFAKLAAVGIAALAAAAAAIGAVFAKIVNATANVGDQLAKMSTRTGVAVETLSAMTLAAELSGTTVENFGESMRMLNKNLFDASQGTGLAKDAFKILKIEIDNADGSLPGPEEVFLHSAEALSKIENTTTKAALAGKIFGERYGPQLIPLLNQGREGIEKMQEEARRMGLIFDKETSKAAEDFNDEMTRLRRTMQGIIFRVGRELLPIFTRLVTTIKNVALGFSEALASGEGFLGVISKIIKTLFPAELALAESRLSELRKELELFEKTGEQVLAEAAMGIEGDIDVATVAIKRGTVEWENQRAEIQKLIAAEEKNVKTLKDALKPLKDLKDGMGDLGGISDKVAASIAKIGVAIAKLSVVADPLDKIQDQILAIEQQIAKLPKAQSDEQKKLRADLEQRRTNLIAFFELQLMLQEATLKGQKREIILTQQAIENIQAGTNLRVIALNNLKARLALGELAEEERVAAVDEQIKAISIDILNIKTAMVPADEEVTKRLQAQLEILELTQQRLQVIRDIRDPALLAAELGLLDAQIAKLAMVGDAADMAASEIQKVFEELGLVVEEISKQMRTALSDNFFAFFKGEALNFQNFWSGLWDTILRKASDTLAELVTDTLFSFNKIKGAAGGGAGGGIGGLLSSAIPLLSSILPFQRGGIVTRPTAALLGEAGPEAVIPLRGMPTRAVAAALRVPFMQEGGVVRRPTLLMAGEAGPERIEPLSKTERQEDKPLETTIINLFDRRELDALIAAQLAQSRGVIVNDITQGFRGNAPIRRAGRKFLI